MTRIYCSPGTLHDTTRYYKIFLPGRYPNWSVIAELPKELKEPSDLTVKNDIVSVLDKSDKSYYDLINGAWKKRHLDITLNAIPTPNQRKFSMKNLNGSMYVMESSQRNIRVLSGDRWEIFAEIPE